VSRVARPRRAAENAGQYCWESKLSFVVKQIFNSGVQHRSILDGVTAVPSEIRHIVFSTPEVASGIREYRRHIGRPLPAGRLRHFDMHPGKGGIRVSVEIAPETGRTEHCEFSAGEMTDALILYCNAHHIPLPSAGIKTLQRFGESLLLIVTLNLGGSGWPLSAGLAMQGPKVAPVMEMAAAGD